MQVAINTKGPPIWTSCLIVPTWYLLAYPFKQKKKMNTTDSLIWTSYCWSPDL